MNSIRKYLGTVVFFLSCIYLFYFSVQTNFLSTIIPFAIAFASYYIIYQNQNEWWKNPIKFIFILGLAIRLAGLLAEPRLSDDFYRFLWDAELFANGLSPYGLVPVNVPVDSIQNGETLLNEMNSPNYYSVYPPLLQLIFSISAIPLVNSIFGKVIILKMIILAAELISFFSLKKIIKSFSISTTVLCLYWLNPLVIMEGIGNMHPEIIVITGVLLAIRGLQLSLPLLSTTGAVLAIGVKLNPLLLFLPLLKYLYYKDSYTSNKIIPLLGTAGMLILSIIYIDSHNEIANYIESLNLYFGSFEFNGSLYNLMNSIMSWHYGYNAIDTSSAILNGLYISFVIYVLSKFGDKSLKSQIQNAIILWIGYLLLSTTVHPWYLLPAIPLAIILNLHSVLIWSFLIVMSYSHYNGGNYYPRYYLLTLEYSVLLYFLWKDYISINKKEG